MPRKSNLLAALDAHKGRDYKLEKQKGLQKKAEKRRKSKAAVQTTAGDSVATPATENSETVPQREEGSKGWESEESEDAVTSFQQPKQGQSTERVKAQNARTHIDSADEVDCVRTGHTVQPTPVPDTMFISTKGPSVEPLVVDSGDSDGGIPLSDIESLSSDEKGDLVPHQRLTINNTLALIRAHKSIVVPTSSLSFSTYQSVTTLAQVSISDVNDDLNRELAFYKQCLDAATEARSLLLKEGAPFTRPTDYFAEMVKSDEHMGKIKVKMTEEAANKRAAAEARRQRDLKKFGKQVQIAKLQEREKTKKDTLDKIKILKRKRKDADTTNANEEDLFDVALEDASTADKAARLTRKVGRGAPRDKRQKKDVKFGFGGKKRFAKSGDAISTGDLRGFSSKKMKGARVAPQRLGKGRRAKL